MLMRGHEIIILMCLALVIGGVAARSTESREDYRRGWCNAQGARYVGNGYCVTASGRAFETPGSRR